ncbi:MAG TPA: response regulator [Candidatus Cloacimonadota bacterium]|nr:response regulator [Candidatus Cloacimonadota bacterium]
MLIAAPGLYAEAELRLGILGYQGEGICRNEWQATVGYLNDNMEQHVSLIPLSPQNVERAVEHIDIDFLITNPAIFAQLESKYALKPIATMLDQNKFSTYASAIIVRTDNLAIKEIKDIEGKRLIAVVPHSFCGWIAAQRELEKHKVRVPEDLNHFAFGGTFERVILSVKNRLSDVGIVPSGLLEEMIRDGQISGNEFRVLNMHPRDHEYPLMRSTELYPKWPLVRLSHVEDHTAQEFASALIATPDNHPSLLAAKIGGWTIPREYQSVHDCLKELHIKPYDKITYYTLRDLLDRYLLWIISTIILIIGLIIFLVYTRRLNRQLIYHNEVMRESREKYRQLYELNRTLTENLNIGISIINPNMELLHTNHQMKIWFPKSLNAKNSPCYVAFNSGYSSDVCANCPVKRALQDGHIHRHIRELETNGKKAYFRIEAVPILDQNSEISSVLEIVEDITHDMRREMEMKAAKEQAEAASKAKSEFLANMSHEIRTPLNGVIGFSELLYDTPLNYTQKQYMENAISSAHSLLGVINDVLDFSKIEAGKLELDIVETDVLDLVEQAADIVKYSAAKKKIELLLDVETDIPRFVQTDPIRLKQVLVNMLSNAVKFTDSGEVQLKLDCKVEDEDSARFSFSISDTGIGISKEQQAKLFKAFSQADSTTARRFGGTGLGLVISNLIVEKMGGSIILNSEPGIGSTFSFELLLRYRKSKAIDVQDLEGKRVLFVDDNEKNRMIMEKTLGHWSMLPMCAEGYKEAMKMLAYDDKYDLIIIDYQMPDVSGDILVDMIRKHYLDKGADRPPIIMYSSADDGIAMSKLKELGLRFRLIKPVKRSELLMRLREALYGQIESDEKSSGVEKLIQPQGGTEDTSLAKPPLVLVAEDNKLNMILICEVLKRIYPGVRIIEAGNGKQALDKYQTEKPDVILMDVQMPEIDGLSASRAIREMEQMDPKLGHMPIIALTAGVTKGERETCLEAGMDDYLSKPVAQDRLEQMLSSYLRSSEVRVKSPTQGCQDPDNEHFQCEKLMKRIFNDRELMRDLIVTAEDQISKSIDALDEAISSKMLSQIQFHAHSIKGTSLNMNLPALADMMKKLEHAAEQESSDTQSLFLAAKQEYQTVLQLWSKYT